MHHLGHLLGMYAFGLQETGDHLAAEAVGRRAVLLNRADVWSIHAVTHVLEMQGRLREGVAWLTELEPDWRPATGLAVHQWWHLALFLIEQERFDEVLEIYDRDIRGMPSGLLLDLVDASALLWRLELAGIAVGTRWEELAAAWRPHAGDHVLVYHDAHLMMAALGSGDLATAERLDRSAGAFIRTGSGTNRATTATVGRTLLQALHAFGTGAFGRAVDLLLPIRYALPRIGGSNAQRDLFAQTLIAAAIGAGRLRLARALLAERVALRPNSARSWRLYAEVLGRLGDTTGAARSAARRAA